MIIHVKSNKNNEYNQRREIVAEPTWLNALEPLYRNL